MSKQPTQSQVSKAEEQKFYDSPIDFGKLENYEIVEQIGRGKYSIVFRGVNMQSGKPVVLKVLKPAKKNKYKREILVMRQFDHPNIIKLKDVLKNPFRNTYTLVTDYFPHDKFEDYWLRFTQESLKTYMR